MNSPEICAYGKNVYIAAPEGTAAQKALEDLATFVDIQLETIQAGEHRLSDVMNPVGITLVADEYLDEKATTMVLSDYDDRVFFHIYPRNIERMQRFTDMSPAVWQQAVAAAGTIGLSPDLGHLVPQIT